MPKFRVEMGDILRKPDNPFTPSLINQTRRRRSAEVEADSEAEVREFFDDAVKQGFDSVRGFELLKVERLSDD